jgi:hypothetical protein
MGTTLWKKDLRWTGLTGVLAHLYVGTENDTGSYKIFLRSWHQHSEENQIKSLNSAAPERWI